jgi:hypothetical protein
MENIAGYSIVFKLKDNKLIAGDTSSSLDIAARVKESLTKADNGNTQRDVTGHDITFSTSGVMQLLETEEKQVSLDAEDLMELALLKGSAAKIPFVYTRGSMKSYKGIMIITSYNETTDAEGNATYALNCSVSGELTLVTE